LSGWCQRMFWQHESEKACGLSASSVFAMTQVSVVFLGTQYKTWMLAVASKPAQEVFLHFSNKFDAIDHINLLKSSELINRTLIRLSHK